MVGNRATRVAIRCLHCPSGDVRCTGLQSRLRPTVVRVRSLGLPVGSPTHPPQGLFKGKSAADGVSAHSEKKCVSACWMSGTCHRSPHVAADSRCHSSGRLSAFSGDVIGPSVIRPADPERRPYERGRSRRRVLSLHRFTGHLIFLTSVQDGRRNADFLSYAHSIAAAGV
jgi:hypothetical protein